MDQARDRRLAEIARIAVRLEKETGLPAAMVVGQWAVESDWGAQPVGNCNFFGMKKAARHAKCCFVDTHEIINGVRQPTKLEFADYDSLEDSCRDYAWLITHGAPYAKAWTAFKAGGPFPVFVRAVLAIYATAQYGDLVLQIIGQPNVQRAIAEAQSDANAPEFPADRKSVPDLER